ncbi:MAG: TIR domain-containing protein [Desulfobacterales bacterium]|nr:TIR domain-containing protein [Desulfobacterales bacterium]
MSDLDIIRQIEKELNATLNKLDEIEWNSRGYILNSGGQVTGLGLYDCDIGNLNSIISLLNALGNLTQLYLYANQISDISPLSALGYLTQLDLSDNQISDISLLSKLDNLTQLDLTSNEISDISSLSALINLTKLNLGSDLFALRDNEISDISPLSALGNLAQLNLSDNQISDISPLSALGNLAQLDLSDNQISDISPLSLLNNLTELNLSYNPIEELPPWIIDFSMELEWEELPLRFEDQKYRYITFYNNPLKSPPPEIVKQGKQAVKNYFAQIKNQEKDYLFEAKLLIIGEAGAGKTTLSKKIENPDYKLRENEKSTEGIEVIQWEFPLDIEGFQGLNKKFRVNIWDFGGQEIYHSTHQFFLTKRSLYTLVADTRKEDTDFYYWLNIVEMLSDNSPMLIVKNEKQNRHREINERQLRGQFTNLKETLATNLATKRGLPEILKEIQHHITRLPHIGSPLPKTWVMVRETLEKDTRNHISLEEYLRICEKNGFKKQKDKLQLIGYLHDLGVCLHFRHDPLLKRTIILKPEWGTYAVYKVLDNKDVIRKFGRFTKADLTKIWHEDKYEGMQDELLQLMLNFKLCYRIPETLDTYTAPQLMTENQPTYNWNTENNLILRYVYKFMPKGIVTRFIVTMNHFIFSQKAVWKSGVILKKDHTLAEVIEYYDKREIRIRISGKYKKELMTIVTHELDKIHDSFHRLRYDKMIPCNCTTCKGNQSPHFYPFEVLRKFKADNKEIQCQKSYEMIDVRGLTDDISERPVKQDYTGHISEKTVFISYAEEDCKTAERLCNDLEKAGITTWLNKKDLLAGQNWRKEIPRIIRQSNYFLLLISSKSVSEKGFVQKELKTALSMLEEHPENEIFIIPARLDNTEPLDETLQNLQWADLSSYQKGLKQILKALDFGK